VRGRCRSTFVSGFTAIGARRAGYDWRRHAVSSLAEGRGGWLQRADFALTWLLYCMLHTKQVSDAYSRPNLLFANLEARYSAKVRKRLERPCPTNRYRRQQASTRPRLATGLTSVSTSVSISRPETPDRLYLRAIVGSDTRNHNPRVGGSSPSSGMAVNAPIPSVHGCFRALRARSGIAANRSKPPAG
jgi:hypothetical protein